MQSNAIPRLLIMMANVLSTLIVIAHARCAVPLAFHQPTRGFSSVNRVVLCFLSELLKINVQQGS
jgi:hypothetical protein